MRRILLPIQGLLFGPAVISIFFILKIFCPGSAGDMCFADQFAVPIFLPLIAVYKVFGGSEVVGGYEFALVMGYWALVGLLIGFILDLCIDRSQYSRGPRPPL